MNLESNSLVELFRLAKEAGNRRYHRLTEEDFNDYRAYDRWRYINGDSECGSTQESKDWVWRNSTQECPVCGQRYRSDRHRTIDHKLPRCQYPWLSMEMKNLWVICVICNQRKGDKNWYEYEHYIYTHYREQYPSIKATRPTSLLQSLRK